MKLPLSLKRKTLTWKKVQKQKLLNLEGRKQIQKFDQVLQTLAF